MTNDIYWKDGKLFVTVSGENYRACEKSSHNMASNKKKGHYGSGILNTKEDPRKTERVGRLGEMAFSIVYKLPVDFTYIDGGDPYDFIVNGKTINMKTNSRNYGKDAVGLVKVRDRKCAPYKTPKHDLYYVGYLNKEDRLAETAEIAIVGWVGRKYVLGRPEVLGKAKGSVHYNVEIEYKEAAKNDL